MKSYVTEFRGSNIGPRLYQISRCFSSSRTQGSKKWLPIGLLLLSLPAGAQAQSQQQLSTTSAAAKSTAAATDAAAVANALSSKTEMVSFDQALNAIVSVDPSFASQRANLDAAQAKLLSAKGAFLPEFTLSAQKPIAKPEPVVDRQYSATASLNIFRFGADIAGWKAAHSDLEVQTALLKETELTAENTAIDALLTWIERNQSFEVVSRRLEGQKQYHTIARTRFSHGVLPAEEVDKIAIDLSNTEAAFQDAKAQVNTAAAHLRAIASSTSKIVPEAIHIEWPWKDLFTSDKIKKWLSPQNAPEVTPSLQVAISRERAEAYRSQQAYRLIFPSLDFSYSWQRQETTSGETASGREGMITLSMPLFEGFSDYATYHEQAAREITSRYLFEAKSREVPATQDLSRKNFVIAYETALAREKTLASARELLKSSLRRFQAGRAKVDELTLDQKRISDAEEFAIQGWAAAHRALAQLLHSHGQSVRSL